MNWLLRILWFLFVQRIQGRFIAKAKSQGVVAYLKVLQGSRRFLVLALIAFFVLQLTLLGGVGALVTGLMLWEIDPHAKLQLMFGICLFLFVVPVALLFYGLSEGTWYKMSGAEKMVEDVRREHEKEAS